MWDEQSSYLMCGTNDLSLINIFANAQKKHKENKVVARNFVIWFFVNENVCFFRILIFFLIKDQHDVTETDIVKRNNNK